MAAETSLGAPPPPIRLVSSANEAYAVGLAAMVSSVLAAAASPARIMFLVLDCGLTSESRRKLSQLVSGSGAEVQFLAVDLTVLGNVDTTGHGGAAAYARILCPSILHEHHGKVIYLDADVIVRRDLEALLDHALDDARTWAWAAPEVGVPFVSSPTGVFDWKEQGMDPTARYFNSGVLVFDLDTWRKQRITDRTLDYLRTHGPKVSWWDQGGLNVALYGHWRALDLRWNQTHAILEPEDIWLDAGFDAETIESVRTGAFVVHFSGSLKPWQYGCADPRAFHLFDALSGTPWASFKPRTPFLQTSPGRFIRKAHRAAVNARSSHLSPLIDQLARTIVPARRRAIRDEQARQRGFDALMQTLLDELRVRSGPFAGMRYVRLPSWGHLGPLLIGAYEAELHDALEEFIARGYETVVDVGCAEGYYVVGLARRLGGATVHGFDIDPAALARCREMAALNGVDERVCLHGRCTPEALNELIEKPALMIVDCEGYEIDLLDPRRAPRLEHADMIVELHDFIEPAVSSRLTARFIATHEITVLDAQPRDPQHYPELEGWPRSVQSMVLDERRPVAMQWAVFRSKSSRRAPLNARDSATSVWPAAPAE